MTAELASLLHDLVPFTRTLGITYDEITAERAVARLADREELHNHVGGPHAGALFTVAESASGALVLAAYGDQLGRAVPVTAAAEVRYRKLAKGDVTAEAVTSVTREDTVAALDAGETPRIPVEVTVRDAEGEPTAEMTFTWALRPNA